MLLKLQSAGALLAQMVLSQSCPTSCPMLGNTLVQDDGSIRMMDASRAEFCAFKKYSSYEINDEIWFRPCDVSNDNINKAGKYRFRFDAETGLVSSAGAKDLMSLDLCWRISSLIRFGKQRVLLAACDAADANQQFTVINGRLHLIGETRICLGFEEHRLNAVTGIAMTVQDCYPSVFGSNAGCLSANLVDSDQAIFPAGLTDKCLFKRYAGFAAHDEIWVDTCQVGSANVNKAGKYQWSYDSETGLISSVGALSFGEGIAYCMKINNKDRFYKQRVKLARCDASDELQQMDYTNGRIYSRANPRLCGGFEYNKLASDGRTAFIFSTCYPSDFAVNMADSSCIDPNEPTTTSQTPTTTIQVSTNPTIESSTSVQSTTTNADTTTLSESLTLKQAAAGTGTLIGSMFKVSKTLIDQNYTELITQQLSILTNENPCKMKNIAAISSDPETFDWQECDDAVNFAHENNMAFKFHCIFWAKGSKTPDWADDMSAEELESWSFQYIDMIAERYGNKLGYVDVINELIDIEGDDVDDNDKGWQAGPWAKIDDFACKVFNRTREQLPESVLIYNDYSHESTYWSGASNKVYSVLECVYKNFDFLLKYYFRTRFTNS